MKQVKRRNRAMTMERILRAMGDVMAEKGTKKAGINAVAEKAGVNKVLIYRYFGGWNGLLEAYVQRGFFLSMFNERFLETVPSNPALEERSKIWSEYVIRVAQEFRGRKSSQELIRWEMQNGETELARRLSAFRNESYKKIIDKLAPFPSFDPAAVTAIVLGGITYLTLISDNQNKLVDIDLSTDEGWSRVETAVRRIFSSLSYSLNAQELSAAK